MGEGWGTYRVMVGGWDRKEGRKEGRKEEDHLEDLRVVGGIILILMFKIWDVEPRTGLMWLRIRTGDGLL
jgi:hypothetical protein